MIDALELADLDRSRPLPITPLRAEVAECQICGVEIFRDSWAVTLPRRRPNRACPGCAADKGFETS